MSVDNLVKSEVDIQTTTIVRFLDGNDMEFWLIDNNANKICQLTSGNKLIYNGVLSRIMCDTLLSCWTVTPLNM